MKKPLKLIRRAPPPSDDEQALAIGREVMRLCKADRGGFQLHVWFTGDGVQANYAEGRQSSSWAVAVRMKAASAILAVLTGR